MLTIVKFPLKHFSGCLTIMLYFTYFDCFPSSSEASWFHHKVCMSGHFSISSLIAKCVPLALTSHSSAGCICVQWIVYFEFYPYSSYDRMSKEVDYESRLYVKISWYASHIYAGEVNDLSVVPDMNLHTLIIPWTTAGFCRFHIPGWNNLCLSYIAGRLKNIHRRKTIWMSKRESVWFSFSSSCPFMCQGRRLLLQ